MHNWQVDDMAITCNDPSGRQNGLLVTITSLTPVNPAFDCIVDCPARCNAKGGINWGIEFRHLKPLPGNEDKKYYEDWNTKVKWAEHIFIPEEPVKVET